MVNVHTQGQEFEVHIRSNSSAAEEWKRAMEAPVTELPQLSDAQKEMAKRFEVTEEEYARGELASIYSRQRLKVKGERLGSIVGEILQNLGRAGRVAAVLYEGGKLRWIIRIEMSSGVRNIALAYELVNDVIDSELFQAHQELRQTLDAATIE